MKNDEKSIKNTCFWSATQVFLASSCAPARLNRSRFGQASDVVFLRSGEDHLSSAGGLALQALYAIYAMFLDVFGCFWSFWCELKAKTWPA